MSGSLPTLPEASRFLAQATLGADYEEIQAVTNLGYDAWLADQFAQAPGYHLPYTEYLAVTFPPTEPDQEVEPLHRRYAWWQQAMTSPDLLRQRVAFALSEIFVISDNQDVIEDTPLGVASYYDVLVRHAFGNYRDLLRDVSLHPVMGVYLSHLNNERSDAVLNRFPDENYAREIMQLLSIGLHELHPDGSQKVDTNGVPVATYSNAEITEFAKVFTGLSMHDANEYWFGNDGGDFTAPMVMWNNHHEPGPKNLLYGQVVPDGQSGMEDIEDAIDNLFYHPNVGPFIGRLLIQRLVKSNPGPGYIYRVASAFNDNGSGVRGDMKAVIRAVLLDPEARNRSTMEDPAHGMLREPWIRYVQLLRTFNAANANGNYPLDGWDMQATVRQHVLSAPSVFNFFLPDYQPLGPIEEAGLVAPEFQITTAPTIVNFVNYISYLVFDEDFVDDDVESPNFGELALDLSDEIALAGNAGNLVDRLDLLLTCGNLSEESRTIIHNAASPLGDPTDRVKMALHLFLISPEYSVMK